MDVDLDRPLGEDEHMEYDDLPSASQPVAVGGDDQAADHDGDALMDDGEVGAGEEEMEAEPTPPLGDTVPGPGPSLSFPDSGSGSGSGVGFVATEQVGLTAPSGPQTEGSGIGGHRVGETREEDMTPAEAREGGDAGAVKLPLTDLPQEDVQIVSDHVGEDQHGPEGSGERAPDIDHRRTDGGEMATTAQATISADQPGEASQNVPSGVADASAVPQTDGHAKTAAENGTDYHAEGEVEGDDEEYYEEELEERDAAHGVPDQADGNGEGDDNGEGHIGEEDDEAEDGDDGGDYSALSELALDVHSLPPIIIHLPDLGARALFAPLPPNEVDAGGKALSLPVWLEGRQEELGEASLTDVLAAIHAAVIREGLNQSGEMVIAEHSMDLKMGEDDVNLQSITFLEFISAYLECDLPEPVQLHMHFEPSRFIARYNAILVALGHKDADADVSVEETKAGQTAQPVSSLQGKALASTPREAQNDAAVTGKSAPRGEVMAEAEPEHEDEYYEVVHGTEAGREVRQEDLQSAVREGPRDKQRYHDTQAQYGESQKRDDGSAFPIATAASAKYTEPLRPAYVGSPRYITSPARDRTEEPADTQHEIVAPVPPRSAGGGRRDGEPNDTTDESFVESSEPEYQGLVPEPASHEIVLAADSAEPAEPAEEEYEGGEENQTESAGDQEIERPTEAALLTPPVSAAPSTADVSIPPPREEIARLARPRPAPQPAAAITPGLTATGVFLDQQASEGSAARPDHEQIVEDVQNEPEVSAPTEEAGDAGELKEEPEAAEAGSVINDGHEEVAGEQEEQGDEQETYEEGEEEGGEGEGEYEEYEEEAEGEEDEGEFDVDEFVAAEDRKAEQADVVQGETVGTGETRETGEMGEIEPAAEAEEPEVEVTVTEKSAALAPESAEGGAISAQLTEIAEEDVEAAEAAEGDDVLPSNEQEAGGSTESSTTIQDESPEDAEEVDEEEEYEEGDEAYDEEEYDDAEGEEYEDPDEDEGGDQEEEPEVPLTGSSVPEKRSVEEDEEVDERETKRSRGAD